METLDSLGVDAVILTSYRQNGSTSYRQNGSTKSCDTAAEVDACHNDLDLIKVKVTVDAENDTSGREDHTADAEQCGCCFYHPRCLQRFAKPVTYVYLYTCMYFYICMYIVEVWKSLVEEGVDMLLDLLQKIFEQEKMPEEWRDSVIVPIFKEKGDIQDCGNYRGIKMISHTMKIWERVIDRRLREETTIGEEQFGFMPGRGTTDAIFAARQVIEKHREMQKELHLVFIDLENAYDRVPRQEVWRCLREQGVPEKYVRLVRGCMNTG